jgi:IMP dehydrogenase
MMDCAQPYHTAIMRKFEALRRAVAIPIVAGTVATREAAVAYCNLGASALRIGLGPGSVCTTSTLTGIGVPQISAIMDIASETTRIGVPLIADGGISSGGDILKALAAGADAVMIGRLFAGSTEAPSDVVMHNGRQYKKYQASKYESVELQYPTQWDAVDAYLQSEPVDDFRVEGIGGLIPHTGPVHMTVIQLERALRLGLGFMGAANIHALRQRAEFIVTSRVNGAQRTDAAMVVTEKSRQFS